LVQHDPVAAISARPEHTPRMAPQMQKSIVQGALLRTKRVVGKNRSHERVQRNHVANAGA